ncbi:MAG: BatD family protein [Desulfobulbaceae bacterium]|jgi:hypothetical protein|nr:BatD family protein [Desulfobulbaceae bacterium]
MNYAADRCGKPAPIRGKIGNGRTSLKMQTNTMKQNYTRLITLTGLFWFALFSLATAGEIQVNARVNQPNIFAGQPFALTITVEGADEVIPPDLTHLIDFQVKDLGQNPNSSNFQLTINGRQIESKNTIEFSYKLITRKTDTTTIPAVTVVADGKPYTTKPIAITIKQPEENEYFKLEVRLSKPSAYVGEPLLMTTTWLIGQKARGGGFNLPVLSDNRFKTSVRNDLLPRDQKQLIRIELAGEVILAKQHQKRVGNQDFTAITFFHTLIPQTAGELTLPQGTIAVDALSGYQTAGGGRNRDPFAIWGSRQREIYNTIVVPANPVSLTVLPLPQHDVPPSFNGLVGHYSIKASAEPLTVNVGDPITLQLEIGGEAATSVTMPSLFFDRFKISNDPVKQRATDDAITFTTTIRARDEEVTEIPGIPLSFFNVESGQYETVHTTPIPITVRATRIITADDALGGSIAPEVQESEPGAEVHRGIRYNYSDIQEPLSPGTNKILLWVGLFLPVALFVLVMLLKRDIDTGSKEAKQRKKQAMRQLKKALARKEDPFPAWLTFLGNELNRPPQTITVQDVLPRLRNQPELAKTVQHIFQTGEALTYGGASQPLEPQTILAAAHHLHQVL